MDDRFNTIAGWVLFAGIVALGSSIVAGEYYHGERPEKMGYPIEGVQEEGEGGAAAAEHPIEFYLASADPAKGQQIFNKCMACHNADKGGANMTGPNLWGVLGEPVGQGHGLRLLRRAGEEGRHLELGQSQPVADQPQGLRAGHQDDLRRPEQPAGPGQRHGLPQRAQQFAPAAAQGAGSRRGGRWGRGRNRPQQRSPEGGEGARAQHRRGRGQPEEYGRARRPRALGSKTPSYSGGALWTRAGSG